MAFFVLLSFTWKESKMKNLVTVAEYPQSQIPERYIRIRDLKRACIICQYWTSRRDLRKDKRYLFDISSSTIRYALQLLAVFKVSTSFSSFSKYRLFICHLLLKKFYRFSAAIASCNSLKFS